MNITALAVRHWQMTIVVFALAILLGVQAFFSIPRSVDPPVSFPAAITTVVLPGADAADMEETVAKPIEDALQGLDKIRFVTSTSSDGVAVIGAEFDYGTDPERSLDQVIRDVSSIRSSLPAGIARLQFRRPRATEAAVLQIALVSKDASWRRMQKYAQDLQEKLNVVPGVRNTLLTGLRPPEVQVLIDSGRLSEARLPPSAVSAAITAAGADLAAGAVHIGDRRFNVATGGAFRDLEAIRRVPIRASDGRVLRVADVATVDWGTPEELALVRYNGERAVFVAVRQKDGTSATPLRNALVQAVDAYKSGLPPDIRAEIGFDQSQDINHRLGELARDFAIALTLVLITLFPLGLRPSLIVMVSIPTSLAIGVFMLAQLGFTLNQISISGFVIALGLLFDDSIVVTENVSRHLRQGDSAVAAAISGTREIAAAVLGSTGVLLFAFLPLAFLPEGSGDFVRGLPAAVIVTVAASLVVSLTIIPFLASRMLKGGHDDHGNAALRWLMHGIERFYHPFLHRALDRPRTTLIAAMAFCLVTLGLIPVLGFTLFPSADAPYFMVRVETPEGSSVATTDRAVRAVSAIIAQEKGIRTRMDNVGRGNPQIFYNNIPTEDRTRFGEVFVILDKWDPTEGPALLKRLRGRLDRFSDARVTVVNFENGPPIEAPVLIRIAGPELATLKQLSGKVADQMRATPGLRDINDPLAIDRVDIDLGVDETKAGLLGVAAGEAKRALRLAITGERAASFRDSEGDSYPVSVRLPIGARQPIDVLGKIYLPTAGGGSVPLSQIATPSLKSVPGQINRYQLQRTVSVSAYTEPGTLPTRANAQVVEALGKISFPSGYRWTVGGAAEVAARNTSGLGGIILLAVFGIFGVLVAEFGRFREVLVVAGVIPLGFVGGLIALFLTGNSLSFLAVIGFVALIGIEIKNSILLVDFTTQLRGRGMDLRESIERAGEIRFLPVLLTSVTAIGGLLPLALSGQALYSPLAWVIIGGLVSSTLLSRIVTPVMYLLIVRNARPVLNEALGEAPGKPSARSV